MAIVSQRRYRCRNCGNRTRTAKDPGQCSCGTVFEPQTPPPRIFPLEPLVECAVIWKGVENETQLADALDCSPDYLRRLRAEGMLNYFEADRFAIELGLHPMIVWPDSWFGEAMNHQDKAAVAFFLIRRHLEAVS